MELTQPNAGRPDRVWRLLRGHTGVLFGLVLIAVMVGAALLAPWLFTGEVTTMDPINRLKAPSGDYWFGTDMYGRDLYTRTVYGARISLVVGLCVMGLSLTIGLFIGLLSGYLRLLDAVIMRIMDGLMAIPGILLAIAMIALAGASLTTVVLAITIPEIPRVVRLVRSVVLTIREEPYVEA
ncbi:MAG: ABC transporter permease, partial [Alphaproteobacteria bacterium]|nr:ABC transporter permease [Alphaproteobacteria bacterium]